MATNKSGAQQSYNPVISKQPTKKPSSSITTTNTGLYSTPVPYNPNAKLGSPENPITVNTTLADQYRDKAIREGRQSGGGTSGGGSGSTTTTVAGTSGGSSSQLEQPTLIPADIMTGKSVGEGIMTPERFKEMAGAQPQSKMPEEFRPQKDYTFTGRTSRNQSVREGAPMTKAEFIEASKPDTDFLPVSQAPLTPAELRKKELRQEIELEVYKTEQKQKNRPDINMVLNPLAPETEYGQMSIMIPLESAEREAKADAEYRKAHPYRAYLGDVLESGKGIGTAYKDYAKEIGVGKVLMKTVTAPTAYYEFWIDKPTGEALKKKGAIRESIVDFGSALVNIPSKEDTTLGYWKNVFKESSENIGAVEQQRQNLISKEFQKEQKKDDWFLKQELINTEVENRYEQELLREQGLVEIQRNVRITERDLYNIDLATFTEAQGMVEKDPENLKAYQRWYEITSQLRQTERIEKSKASQQELINQFNLQGLEISGKAKAKSQELISAREKDYALDLQSYEADIKSTKGKDEARALLGLTKESGFISYTGEYTRGITYNIFRNVANVPLDVGMMLSTGTTKGEIKSDILNIGRSFKISPVVTSLEIGGTIAVSYAISSALGGSLTKKGALKKASSKTPEYSIIYEESEFQITPKGTRAISKGSISYRYKGTSSKTIYSNYQQTAFLDNDLLLKSTGKVRTSTGLRLYQQSTFELKPTQIKVSPTGTYTGEGIMIQESGRLRPFKKTSAIKINYNPIADELTDIYGKTQNIKGTGFGSVQYADYSLEIGKFKATPTLPDIKLSLAERRVKGFKTTYVIQYEGLVNTQDIYTGLRNYKLYQSSKMPIASEFVSQRTVTTGKGLSTSLATGREINKLYENIAKSQAKQSALIQKSKAPTLAKDTGFKLGEFYKGFKETAPKAIKRKKPAISYGGGEAQLFYETTTFRAGGGTEAISRATPSYDTLTGTKSLETVYSGKQLGLLGTTQAIGKELAITRGGEALTASFIKTSLIAGYSSLGAGIIGTLGATKQIAISTPTPLSSASLGISTGLITPKALSLGLVESRTLSISVSQTEAMSISSSEGLSTSEATSISDYGFIPISPIPTAPVISPPMLPFIYPSLPSGSLSFPVERQTRLRRQPKGYTPSILAFDIGKIIEKAPKNRGFTGFEIRGIPKSLLKTRGGLL